MKNKGKLIIGFCIWGLINFLSSQARCQTYDTISNWDGITQNWTVWAGGSQLVANPHPDSNNPSEHCFDVVTSSDLYDLMFFDMPEAANFIIYPRYNLKIFAPEGGGDIVLKFENSDNTVSHEILMTPVPGQWTNLNFNFSDVGYENLTRMVIFIDFQSSTVGQHWYIDDITKEIPAPLVLQTNLPIVVINTFGASIPDDPKITAHLGIIDNGAGVSNNLSDPYNNYNGFVGIEIRGQSTQMYPKKNYDFETRDDAGSNLDVSLLGLPEENDWILYAPYSDKSMLRNAVSFSMGRNLDAYCSRTVFCELVLNGDYKGVYILMERIKKSEFRVDIATLKPDEVSGDNLTGGYIIKVDKLDIDFSYATDGWRSNPSPAYPNAMDITFQYYYPESDEIMPQQKTYIKDYVTTAENTLTSTNFTDPDLGYKKYIDVPSFIDMMLLSEIAKEVDKYRYSTYFYKDKDSDGGKLFAGPAWDFNLGYGNVDYWSPGIDYTGWLYTLVENNEWGIMFWWKRLMEDMYFRDMVKTRWISLRQEALSNNHIHTTIDSILTLTEAAKDRNYERWPILGHYVWPNYDWQNNTYADEVEYFENFLFNRLQWMDNNITGNIVQPWLTATAAANKIHLKLNRDYFRQNILKKGNFQLNNSPWDLTIISVQYLNASECVLTLSADITDLHDLTVTASKKILNTWQDLTSNPLGYAAVDEPLAQLHEIKIFEASGQIHLQCDRPEFMPDQIEILNLTGQSLGIYSLEKSTKNNITHHLKPGIYLVVIKVGNITQVQRVAVLG
jgi:hypothetical protein